MSTWSEESWESANRSPEEIERDIEGTRQQLNRTLNELTSRLSPRERLVAAAESARDFSHRLRSSAGRSLAPHITSMIRLDHTHALALFRRFRPTTSLVRKRALAANLCLALEVHAHLEEEIFYPALRQLAEGNEVLAKSASEHEEVRKIIGRLRNLAPSNPSYDQTVWQLMRLVLHHVADEESTLLPLAERAMPGRLGDLGVQMMRRRVELLRPHLGELVRTSAQSFPVAAILFGASFLAMAWFAARAISRPQGDNWDAYRDTVAWH